MKLSLIRSYTFDRTDFSEFLLCVLRLISQYLYFAELALDKIEDILEYDEMAYGKKIRRQAGSNLKTFFFLRK